MTPGHSEIGPRIMDLILDRLNVDVSSVETDLIESGLLDSLALVTLIAALEESFACELPLENFDLECFRTVRRISDFLSASCDLSLDGRAREFEPVLEASRARDRMVRLLPGKGQYGPSTAGLPALGRLRIGVGPVAFWRRRRTVPQTESGKRGERRNV